MKALVLAIILMTSAGAAAQVSAAQKADLLDLVRQANFRQSQLIRLYEAAQKTRESYERYLKELEEARMSDPAIASVFNALAEGRELTSDEEAVLQRYRQARDRVVREHNERISAYARSVMDSMSTEQMVLLGLADNDKRDVDERMQMFTNASPEDWPRVRDRLAREVARVITQGMERQRGESRREYELRREQLHVSAAEWLNMARNNRRMWDEVRLRLAMAEEREERILQRVHDYIVRILTDEAAVEALRARLANP
jgi:membrane-associated HD superfamily phosphohydrolase